MKVNLLGFEIQLATGVSVGDFYQQLESIEDKDIKIRSRTSVLYTDIVENLICGLVLSYKTNKKSLVTTRDSDGDLTVTKNTLKNHEHGTEVSLFAINPVTLRGIFYSYSGSVSPNGLAEIFKSQHDIVLRYKKKSYKDELTNLGVKKVNKLSQKIREKYPGSFVLRLLATPSDLKNILSRYSDIRSVVLRATNALSESGRFTPLQDISKRGAIIVDLEEGGITKEITKTLLSVFGSYANQKKESALRIIGLGYSGEELSLVVGENTDNFGRIDYDEFVDLLPREKWRDYKDCEAMLRIVIKVSDMQVVFGDAPVNKSWKLLSAKDFPNKVPVEMEAEEAEL